MAVPTRDSSMIRSPFRFVLILGPALAFVSLVADAQPPQQRVGPEYRTVANAITTKVSGGATGGPGQTGYLGVSVVGDTQGNLLVEDVSSGSPGAKAGLKAG